MKVKKIIKDVMFFTVPPAVLIRFKFFIKSGYMPHVKKWRSFNEYINHIKLYDRNQMRILFADRLAVREYVKIKTPEAQLIKLLWVGSDFTKDVFDSLPDKFVLKATHGSGMVEVVNKKNANITELNKKCQAWLKCDFAKYGCEWFYKNLPRLIICEEFIESENGEVPEDYKFFVINGKVEMIQVDCSRFSNHTRNIYNVNFEKLDIKYLYPNSNKLITKPKCLDMAIIAAEKLATGFPFLCIDLYLVGEKVYFGEITNAPEAGFGKFNPRKIDFDLGTKIKAAF